MGKVHKATGQDDKRLANTLKRIGMNAVPAIEEVNMFKADGEVIHFANPKVQANIAANTYVINWRAEAKKLTDMLPGIISQLGPDNLSQLKQIGQSLGMQGKAPAVGGRRRPGRGRELRRGRVNASVADMIFSVPS